MRLGVVVSLLLFFVILIQNEGCHGCLEKERIGLLNLKAYLSSMNNISFIKLDSWVNDKSSNCCHWERVKCSNNNSTYGHVTHLALSHFNKIMHNFSISGSLFRPFQELLHLDLSSNSLAFTKGLPRLTKLETLYLSRNMLAGSFRDLGIYLQFARLKVLDLGDNNLNGSIEGLCNMQDLIEIGLSSNQFSGQIPECLNNLRNLQILDLSQNLLSGKFPSFISNMTSLVYLSFFGNYLHGSFALSTLANHSKLQVLYISSQGSELHVETEEKTQWFPTFQLKDLILQGCNLNRDSGSVIPKFLQYQNQMKLINLPHNKLVGEFPNWLIQNNSRLEYFSVRNNSFMGNLQLFSIKKHILQLDISKNNVSGSLPKDIGKLLPMIEILNLSKNNFDGSIPTSIGNMQTLVSLDLSHNLFSGELPELQGLTLLEELNLSDNLFHGNVPKLSAPMSGLFVNDNNFNCTLKEVLKILDCSRLVILDISNNLISGEIPSSIVNLSSVSFLHMAENQLEGEIPPEFFNLTGLFLLDLSQNKLSGSISHVNTSTLKFLYLQMNYFSGSIPKTLLKGTNLVTLDLSDNNFSGNIPYWMGNLSNLQVLSLGGNNFIGHIPIGLCQLKNITIMDLSYNKINGSIPFCFNNLSFGRGESDYFTTPFVTHNSVHYSFFLNYNIDTVLLFSPTTYLYDGMKASVEFRTKHNLYSYSGNILRGMSGMDLSSNRLTGDIPFQIGNLQQILSLNLSHNHLSGSIPNTFSNLTQIESLDLSCNNLSGEIPSELTKLNFLGTFNVSYNNLSGIAPSIEQFGTFVEDSYRGNPLLCGLLLKRKCDEGLLPLQFNILEGEEPILDMVVFYWSFVASSITILLVFTTVLCTNAYCRMAWFYFIGKIISKCFPNLPLY